MDCFVYFYQAEEETENNSVIGNMPLHASHDIIETNNVDFQPMLEGVVTQTGQPKRDKNVYIPPTPLNVTTGDTTCISIPIDIDIFFPSRNKSRLWFNKLQGLLHHWFKCC